MRIRDLSYHAPETVEEACELLGTLQGEARVIAGGTDVLADLKQGTLAAEHLVSLGKIEALAAIEERDGGLFVGALATPNRIAESAEVGARIAALADGAASMGGYQIRNLATLGGNLVSAVPSADLPPALLAADAVLLLRSAAGARRLPVREFFTGVRKTALAPGEIVEGALVPHAPPGTGTAYEKFMLRDASALAVVGVAALLTVTDGRIERAEVAVGAAAPTPVVIEEAGAALVGEAPAPDAFRDAGRIAAAEVKPTDDLRGSAKYRRRLAGVLTERALERALHRAKAPEAAS